MITGYLRYAGHATDYDAIPAMLNVLTNNAQGALEDGIFGQGDDAVLEYIARKNPNIFKWFKERHYKLKVGAVNNYAVVMVCDHGKPVFEDTFCEPGFPDKDFRSSSKQLSCDITMTPEEVKKYCR